MTSYRTFTAAVDSKKEEFRKYLERTGVLEKLTRALVGLYEEQERPEDAVAYVTAHLDPGHSESSSESLKQELEQAQKRIAELQLENNELKSQQAIKGEVEEAVVAEPEL
ncbi:c-Myc-binding protein [Amblyomma americanum]|uniref:C-myc-binding protein n=2 Tax=Amblyomma americanum TaxID=6943 RepID=A0AAQ4E038_AMBAM